jgi:hypothetical protein
MAATLTPLELTDWFSKTFRRVASANNVLKTADDCFRQGDLVSALQCTDLYLQVPMDGDSHVLSGYHLRGWILLKQGAFLPAAAAFKTCVSSGLEDDWQMLVQCTVDAEAEGLLPLSPEHQRLAARLVIPSIAFAETKSHDIFVPQLVKEPPPPFLYP